MAAAVTDYTSVGARPNSQVGDKVERRHLSHQIAAILRSEIVHGVIPAGTHLVQMSLCERFGTSRVPIRDALQKLESEGLLVDRSGQRVVVELREDEVIETYTLIAVLNSWAASQMAQVGSDAEIRELERLGAYLLATDDPVEFSQRALSFHAHINHSAHSDRLVDVIFSLQRTIPRFYPLSIPDKVDEMRHLYRSIIRAVAARDADAAEQSARALSAVVTVDLSGTEGLGKRLDTDL